VTYGRKAVAKVRDPRSTWHWRMKVRPVVLQRDRYTCHWNYPGICRGRANTVDHVIALAEGGAPYDLSNLVAACGPCNSSRSPGGRRGWVKGQGMRSSYLYAPRVRISQHALLDSARFDGSSQRNEEVGSFLSEVGAPVCAPRPSLSPSSLSISRGLPAEPSATQRPPTDSSGPGGFPRLSGFYGRPRGAA
jgi:hypothetical protein